MQKIRIDFDNPGLPQHISAVENDSQSRFFQAMLYENGKAYTAPAGASYSIMYRGFGPQNQGWYDTISDGSGKRTACKVSGNVVTCEIARQALQVPGHVSIVLCVTTGKGYMVKSWPIECDCKNDRYDSTAEIQSFFYITQVSNADWNRAIQALEELKNTIDPTLSLSGKAADAAKVGEAVGELKEDLSKKAECSFFAYGSDGKTITVSDDYKTVDFSGESITIKGDTNKLLPWSKIIDAAKQNTELTVNGSAITGSAYIIGYSPKRDIVVVINPDQLPHGFYTLYGHIYTTIVFGPLYEQMLAKKTNALEVRMNNLKLYGETVAYFDNGFVPEITYEGNNSTIKFKANISLNLYGGINGTFTSSDIIAAAKAAGITVDEANYTVTGKSYVLYVNKLTSTVKALNSITRLPSQNIIILYAHHYMSIEFGPLYEQVLAKKTNARISSLEEKTSITSYVPSYYQVHMEEKSKEILQNMEDVGKNGDTFIFITDLHWESNTKNSPALVKYLEENLNINTILCGGDLINQGTKENMENNMRKAVRAFSNLRLSSFPIAFGNHDSNWNDYGGQHDYPERKFNASAQYALMQKQSEELISYFTTTGWNFYFDKPATKTRYIVLDTGESGAFYAYSELSKALLDTPAGYHIVIMAHWLYDASISTACVNIQKMIDAYNSRGSVSISDNAYNYSSAVAHISLLLGGHLHNDMSWSTESGIPVVLVDCDAGYRTDNTVYPFVAGTITEQAFDVITLDYINNTVKCVRIGRGANRNFN
nr:MAG TPA_asm: Calcineurin-like phosphoesterase [Caudoviricetes sp.]